MTPLSDFLDHGILPFAGRKREMEIIVDHWRQSTAGDRGLHILVLTGEAGVGKSRLVQQGIGRIESERGIVVHLKLYPESVNAFAPLLAAALGSSRNGRGVLRGEPEETLAAGVETLRRFARLRPTMLVVEDIHLLAGETLREFAQVIEGVRDEPISLLCAARPLDCPARGVIERWTIHEVLVEPLSRGELGEIWQTLFEQEPARESLDVLWQAALGNPLALRAAMRGAIQQGGLALGVDNLWSTGATFATVTSRSVRSLADGMFAHLGDEARRAAERLAALGEVFSRTAALGLVEDRLLEDLLFSGVVHELALRRVPIPGLPTDSDLPLAFSHSLVHRQLAERTSITADELLDAIRAPLYSVHPFRLIAVSSAPMHHDACEIHRAINAALRSAVMLDATPDWTLATPVWEAAQALLRLNEDLFDQTLRRTLLIEVVATRISLLRRTLTADEYARCTEQLLSLTDPADTDLLLQRRISAFASALWLSRRRGVEHYREICRAVGETIAENPMLRFSQAYSSLLRNRCRLSGVMRELDYRTERREIEREYRSIVDSEGCTPEQRRFMQENVAPFFLLLFDTDEELEERRTLYRQLRGEIKTGRALFILCEIDFLSESGSIDELLAAILEALPVYRAAGMMVSYCNRRLVQLWGEGMLGRPLDEIERGVGEIDDLGQNREFIGYGGFLFPCTLGFLLGRPEWSARMIETYLHYGIPGLEVCVALLAAHNLISSEQIDSALGHLNQSDPFAVLTHMIRDETAPLDQLVPLFSLLLDQQTLRINDLLSVRACLDLYRTLQRRGPLPPMAHATLHSALIRTLGWLAERRLPVVIEAFLHDAESLLEAKEITTWRRRAAAIGAERAAERSSMVVDAGARLSMLGQIRVQPSDGSAPLHPHGARQKAFLGALVASEMLARPLERTEFLGAVGIDSDDPKRAWDAVNSALYRLREILGRNCILPATGDEAPRLNRAVIAVDLLDADALLREADEDVRRGAIGRAGVAVRGALEITRGDVPFPSLYNSFFEALREDFENRLRLTVLLVARRLLRELDAAGAEEVLEHAFAITPDDEEIAELYRESLELQGRRAEAERVRRKLEMV